MIKIIWREHFRKLCSSFTDNIFLTEILTRITYARMSQAKFLDLVVHIRWFKGRNFTLKL